VALDDSVVRREFNETAPLAVVVDGVSEKWNRNVLQIMAAPGRVHVEVAGHGVVTAPAFRLSRNQARRLAAEITHLLDAEPGD